jgi:hypothetical protein
MNARNNESKLVKELKIIPGPAWIVAGALLLLWLAAGMPVALHFMGLKQKPGEPPLWFIGGAMTFAVVMLLAVVLLVVYVNFDARRRLMSRTLWTLLVIFVPNAIGFILYFVLRRPLPQFCPQCGGLVQPDFVVCPACGHSLTRQCSSCQRAVQPAWLNCAYCGAKLG